MSALPLPGQLSSKYDAHHCPPSVWIQSPVSLFPPTEIYKENLRLFGYSLGPGGLVLHIMVTTVTRAAVTSLPLPSYPIKDAKGILWKIELGQSKMVAFGKIHS